MDADLTIGICNFNTTELTNACIKSILKQCKSRHFKIIVLDNSTTEKLKLDPRLESRIIVLDNTTGKYADFNNVNKHFGWSYDETYGSLKHTYSVQVMIDMCATKWFLLLDSDVIVKKDLEFLDVVDDMMIGAFDVGKRKTYRSRALPYVQLFNVQKMRIDGIRYFDAQRIRGGMNAENSGPYDTGASFLEDIVAANLPFLKIDFTDYVHHLRSGSFEVRKAQEFLSKLKPLYENSVDPLDPDLEYKVIVSLTSWEKRIKNGSLAKTLKSLLAQKFNGRYKIVLTLTRNETKMLQEDVQQLIRAGKVELLIADEDLKPHKKYYYVMLKHRSIPIITVDDDLVYDDDLVQTLFNAYKEFPECISARRVHLMTYSGTQLNPYRSWKYECKDIVMHPKFELFSTSGGGTLYPENILQLSESELEKIKRVLNADDIYLKKREQELGIQTVFAVGARYPGYEAQPSSVDPESLCFMNNTRTRCDNDLHIKTIGLR